MRRRGNRLVAESRCRPLAELSIGGSERRPPVGARPNSPALLTDRRTQGLRPHPTSPARTRPLGRVNRFGATMLC